MILRTWKKANAAPIHKSRDLTVLVHELLVELDDATNPLGARGEESSPEMEGALALAEAGAGDDADAGSFEEPHAVELIGSAALGGGSLGSLGGQLDGGEEVHGALGLAALDTFHLGEGGMKSESALLEAVEDGVVLLVVELVRGLALLGGVDHELDKTLAEDGGAEGDGNKLVDLSLDEGVEADELEVTTTVATLTNHTLGDGVEGGKLEVVVDARLFLLHASENGLEGVELAGEHVGLVDLIGNENKALLAGELDDGADVSLGKRGTGGVTGVDDDDGTSIDTFGLGLLIRGLDGLKIGTPKPGLVQVIGHAHGIENSQAGGVKRVLGNGDEDAAVLVGAEDV